MYEAFEDTVEPTVGQLKSIELFAKGAPVLLAGTRKDQVPGGEAVLRELSDRLFAELERRCAPAISGLQRCGELCFFAVENQRGYSGDETIRKLVHAIDGAAHMLPSLQKRMPLGWLRVYDALRVLGREARRITIGEVRDACISCGLPHAGLTIEQELTALLSFFHSLGFLLWWDTPALRTLVVLDPLWIIEAATCFIRDFKLKDHTEDYKMWSLDQRALREEPDAWSLLTDGRATLQRRLLDILWSGDDFAAYRTELLDLLTLFGLVVPVPNKPNVFLVPSLLPAAVASSVPHGWPAMKDDNAQLRIFFHLDSTLLDGQAKLIYAPADLSAGFLPLGVFHSLC